MKTVSRIARGLGWFSIALGLTELFDAPGLNSFLGTSHKETTLRLFGLREIAAGVGILTSPKPAAGWLWSRVAGDAMDLAALGAAYENRRSKHDNVAIAIGAVAGVTALDIFCAWKLGQD